MSNVTPLHLLLFGSRKVQVFLDSASGQPLVRLDNWITLQMEPRTVAKILSLRPALDRLIFDVCCRPELAADLGPTNSPLIRVIDSLCHFRAADFRRAETTSASAAVAGYVSSSTTDRVKLWQLL